MASLLLHCPFKLELTMNTTDIMTRAVFIHTDPANRLPRAASEKLGALRDARDDARAVLTTVNEKRNEALGAKLDADRELARIKAKLGAEIRRDSDPIDQDPIFIKAKDKVDRLAQ